MILLNSRSLNPRERRDPSRTSVLRAQFVKEVTTRLELLKKDILKLVEEENAFDLTVSVSNVFCPTGEGGGVDPTCSPGGGHGPFPSELRPGEKQPSDDRIDEAGDDQFDLMREYHNTNDKTALEYLVDHRFSGSAAQRIAAEDNIQDTLGDKFDEQGYIELYRGEKGEIRTERFHRTNIAAALPWEGEVIVIQDGSAKSWTTDTRWAERFAAYPGFAYQIPTEVKNVRNSGRFRFMSSPQKLEAFQQWIARQTQYRLQGATQSQINRSFWEQYIRQGYLKGMGRAYSDVKPLSTGQFAQGAKDQFLRTAFNQPISVEKVQLLAGRTLTDLKGVTETMATQMSRVLVDGLVQGRSPRDVATAMTKVVDISKPRALAIARTETMRAHAEGALDAMEALGVTEVGVAVEWSTSGLDNVCELCADLEGVVLTVQEARGLFPRHPNAVFAGSSFIPYGECLEMVRANYCGPSVVLHASGTREYRTTIGPNHPMMTRRGMVRAADIKEGDEVLYDLRHDHSIHRNSNSEKIVPVENIFESVLRVGCDIGIALPTHDLHGDRMFCYGEVQTVNPTHGLLSILDSFGVEQLRKSFLVESNSNSVQRPIHSSKSLSSVGVLLSSASSVSSSDSGILADNYVWLTVTHVRSDWFKGLAFDASTASSLYCNNGFVVSNCACTPIPANVGEDTEDQIRSQDAIEKAILASIKEDGSSTWAGIDLTIAKDRPELGVQNYRNKSMSLWHPRIRNKRVPKHILNHKVKIKTLHDDVRELITKVDNAFCPTGPGGGQDNSCSPNSGGGGKSLPDISVVKPLGGSTGAKLVQDADGNRFVMKTGRGPAQLREEFAADQMYRAAGVDVPDKEIYEDSNGRPVTLARFEPGRELAELKGAERKKVIAQVQANFAADALLANWDVVGLEDDNIMLTDSGRVLRIDNGGSLRYRAMGSPKGDRFGEKVGELDTLRSSSMNAQAARIFGKLTDEQVASQIVDLSSKREAILEAAPPAIRSTISARLDYMELWAAEKTQAANVFCPTGPGGGVDPTCSPGGGGAGLMEGPQDGSDAVVDLPPIPTFLDKKFAQANTEAANDLKTMAEKIIGGHETLTIDDLKDYEAGGSPKLAAYRQALIKAVETAQGAEDEAEQAEEESKPEQKETESVPKGPFDSKEALANFVSANKLLTKLQLEKIKVLNPNGLKDGVFKFGAFKGKENLIPWLKENLPEGTVIKAVYASAKDLGMTQTLGAGETFEGTFTTKESTTGPHGASSGSSSEYLSGLSKTTIGRMTPVTTIGGGKTLHVQFANAQLYNQTDHAQWRASLTSEQRSAISEWKGSARSYRMVLTDPSLATNTPNAIAPNGYTWAQNAERANAFEAALDKAEVHEGVVYRGVSSDYAQQMFSQIQQIGLGGTWSDDAPHCTSINAYKPIKGFGGQSGLLFRIVSRTSVPIHKEDGYSASGSRTESEVVGRGGVTYRVAGIYENVSSQHGTIKRMVDLVEEPA